MVRRLVWCCIYPQQHLPLHKYSSSAIVRIELEANQWIPTRVANQLINVLPFLSLSLALFLAFDRSRSANYTDRKQESSTTKSCLRIRMIGEQNGVSKLLHDILVESSKASCTARDIEHAFAQAYRAPFTIRQGVKQWMHSSNRWQSDLCALALFKKMCQSPGSQSDLGFWHQWNTNTHTQFQVCIFRPDTTVFF